MEIILQYFNGCPNWEVLDQRLAEVVNDRSDVRVIRQLVETPEDAVRLGFHGSPTVLVDGIDPFADERTHVGLACRMFRTPAGIAGSPTVERFARRMTPSAAVMVSVVNTSASDSRAIAASLNRVRSPPRW